jgi:hypothetical protein
MVHYGRHIIDPATGLCEICDRGAIHEFRQGKRPAKQFLYSNQDGKFVYRPANEEIHYNTEETTPRYVRKPLYPEPSPPVRTRPVVYEETVVQKKTPRYNHSPLNDTQHPSHAHPATFYYVDNTGQMVPRNEGPPEEPRRRYIVQNHYSPPATRPARAVQRRARTPPPPASEPWRSPPKRRQRDYDTEIIQQPYRAQPNDFDHHQSPTKPEMYYIGKPPGDSRSYVSNDHNSPPSKTLYQGDTIRKQRQLEPIERKHYNESEPTVIKKVYKKLPTNKYEHPQEEYIPNGNNLRSQRKTERIHPSPRTTYDSSPQLTNRQTKNVLPNKNPSVYYIDSENGF